MIISRMPLPEVNINYATFPPLNAAMVERGQEKLIKALSDARVNYKYAVTKKYVDEGLAMDADDLKEHKDSLREKSNDLSKMAFEEAFQESVFIPSHQSFQKINTKKFIDHVHAVTRLGKEQIAQILTNTFPIK